MSRREREEHLQEGIGSRPYQSQDRYRQTRTPRTPRTRQTTVSEEEEKELLDLGRAMSREQEESPTYSGLASSSLTSSVHHSQMQTPSRHFTGTGTRTVYDGRQIASDVALPPQASSWAARTRVPQDAFQQGRGLEATPARSNANQLSNFGDGQSQLHGFSDSPSHSIYEEEALETMNVKGANYSHPQSVVKGAQPEQPSQHYVHSQNRHFNMQTASPFAFGQQSSNHTYSRANLEEPSPFMHEQQGSGFTPSLSSIQDPRPFGEGSHSLRAFPSLTNVLSHQDDESTDFRSHQERVAQTGRHFNGYLPAVAQSNIKRGHFNETGSPLEYKSQPTNFSGHQLGSYQTTNVNQNTEYPRFGTNKFANLQDVVKNHGQESPTSSHRSTLSGYKPAHMRYGHGLRADQFQTSEQRDISVPSTPRYPPEVGQSFEASGPRDYSALLATPHRQLEYGHGFEAPTSLQSSELEHRDQRSKSARGYYIPSSYGERPLPPLPRKTGRERNFVQLGLAVREAQVESELEDENRDKICDERGEHAKEFRAGQVKKAKSINNMANRAGTPTSYQPRSYTPDANLGRLPPKVPPPPPPRPTTAFNHLINKVSVGSGADCLARISEAAASTSSIIKEFMVQNMVERFVKSFSKSNERGILAGLNELNLKIDWLGDSLWKGSEDARRLFANQHTETITLIYNRVSSLCNPYMTLANHHFR